MKKILRTISRRVDQHDINALAIKKLHRSRSSQNLKLLARRIKDLARRRRIKVYEYSIKEMEAAILPDEKANKKIMAEKTVSRYPVLYNEFNRETNSRNPYYIRLFEAVALGSVCLSRLDGRRSKNKR